MELIKPSDIRRWLSQDGEDANEQAFLELAGIINGAPLADTIGSLKAFLDKDSD